MKFFELERQYQAYKTEIDSAISNVLTRGDFILGEDVYLLENELEAFSEKAHCVTCGNGTDAIQIALMAIGVQPGDAVFVPSFTFVGTVEPVSALGARPIYCDVYRSDFNVDLSSLVNKIEQTLSEGKSVPKAIIAVDLFGLPCDYEALKRIADKYSMVLIIDSAQSFGSMIAEEPATKYADIITTSFFPAKPLGCYGDGGAIFLNDNNVAEKCRSIRVHGSGKTKYNYECLGMNSRLDTIQAAILRVKLRYLRSEITRRNEIAEVYLGFLPKTWSCQQIDERITSAYAQFSVLVEEGKRSEVAAKLKSYGVPTAVYYPSIIPEADVYADCDLAELPASQFCAKNILSFPINPFLNESELDLVTSSIRKL